MPHQLPRGGLRTEALADVRQNLLGLEVVLPDGSVLDLLTENDDFAVALTSLAGSEEFLRGWGDYQRYSLKLTESERAGLGHEPVDQLLALERLAAHLGIPREATLAIGDQENDLSMIAWAGLATAALLRRAGVRARRRGPASIARAR